jgi:hypothetical protein
MPTQRFGEQQDEYGGRNENDEGDANHAARMLLEGNPSWRQRLARREWGKNGELANRLSVISGYG